MVIREEAAADIAGIGRVTELAFGQRDEADLISALRENGDIEISLVAVDDEAVIGHVLFSKLHAPPKCLALAPVSVMPDRQSRGVGSRLIREGLRRAKEIGWRAVFLLGEPDYYSRFGFRVDSAAGFETPYPAEFFMALELKPGALAQKGPVIYAAPFQTLGPSEQLVCGS